MRKASKADEFIQAMRVHRGIEFARIGMMVEVNDDECWVLRPQAEACSYG
ncbi:hypothetical protein AAAC13_00900 [Pseudomonas aeruginosa]|nr:hypothetical protein [Pseudomonas aeruginosa]EKV3160228.1 hypothetical protein [Pseudomonas aeruginosa]ELL1222027.1 hypothetical protein [Pseudomonas aeruginosa]ELM3831726.1 hypothetical protein [Pseudomonas aeruginosa]EMA3567119.1 hypothetical protein [Pseudomonas aeruginosa]MBG4758483.1 hypothetical protein [Pseudomonas aeruginosa]